MENGNDNTVSKYDRVRGGLDGVALFSKPSTIQNIQIITGKEETFIVETARHSELGDTIFIRCMDDTGVTRLALPPRVANAIARQRKALGKKSFSISAKAAMKERMANGWKPNFAKNRAAEV